MTKSASREPLENEVSGEQVSKVVEPESHPSELFKVGGKKVSVLPFKRAWNSLFLQAALPMFAAELSAPETILKSMSDGSFAYSNTAKTLIDSEIEADKYLDRAAAVILASKIPAAKQDPEKFIHEQEAWLREHATTEEMRALVRAQGEKERLAARVGEHLPARFANLLSLAGVPITEDSLKQLLTSLWQKLPGKDGASS